MEEYTIPLVDESGSVVSYGDRWLSHAVTTGDNGPILGRRHTGITIALLNGDGKILVQHRKHKVFDNVWSLSGDTHPRRYNGKTVETLGEASDRCSLEDLGIAPGKWNEVLVTTYSALDPRDNEYCENEVLHLLVTTYDGPFKVNENNAYSVKWMKIEEIASQVVDDLRNEPLRREFAPWVHSIFVQPKKKLENIFSTSGK